MALAELAAGFGPTAAGADPRRRAERRPPPFFLKGDHWKGFLTVAWTDLGCDRRIARTREACRHPEAAAKRPSKDVAEAPGPSSFEARCRSHLWMTDQ
jgi:hypothetical protein